MIAVDLFAGGGGASLGIADAGLDVVLAVNHDEHAIAMHAANHPNTIHMREDVFAVDPRKACGGRLRRGSVDCLWLSASCTVATQRRIAEGIKRYVLTAARPFVVHLTHGARVNSIDEPMRTVTAANRGEIGLVAPTLVQTGYGEREGQAPRALDLSQPLGTVVAGGSKHALVAAFLARHNGSGERWNASIGTPLDQPAPTVTAKDTKGVVAAHLTKFYGTSTGSGLDEPVPTVTEGARRVAAFLCLYYGNGGQWSGLDEPMKTIVSKARMGLVTVELDGELYAIVDIGLRMLAPRELARAQGFPDSYLLTGTKTQQIARIGNSVSPPVARAVVVANLPMEHHEPERIAAK